MAFIDLHFHPAQLGISTSVSLVLPTDRNETEPLPVLWLLHGGGGCHQDFVRFCGAARLAEQYHMAIVMPDGQNSSWVDMAYGPHWETYLTDALRKYVFGHFPVSSRREDNYIGGISMGGYGALHTALRHPTLYAAACGMGAGVWLPMKYAQGDTALDSLATLDANLEASFGSDRTKVIGSAYDCLQCARDALASGQELPRLLACCGTKDFSYAENVRFRDDIRAMGIAYDWQEIDAAHEQKAWDAFMPLMLRWMKGEQP